MSIGRDETSAAGRGSTESPAGKEMGLFVCRGSLSAIVEMGTRAIVVVVTDGVHGMLVDHTISIEDFMKELGVFNGRRRIEGSILEESIDG
jgi:hypothetical protein